MNMAGVTPVELDPQLNVDDLESPDLPKLARMGKDILDSVQSIRAMLQARSDVLETCREVLTEQHAKISDQRERLEREQGALCDEYEKRELDLTEREKRFEGLEDRIRQLSATFQVEADELKRRAEEIRRRDAEQTQRKIALDSRAEHLGGQERELADQRSAYEQNVIELDADRQKLGAAQNDFESAREKFAQDLAALKGEREQHDEAAALLEHDRQTFQKSLEALEARQSEFEKQVAAVERREQQVVEQQGTLELRIQQLAKQKDDMIALRRRWEEKINELNAASTNLSTLREQLVEEVGHISNERTDLLNRFGLTERTWKKGSPADGGLPSTAEPTPPASVERYQKLCRDARRRAIGAI
jgi:chromosome segregation ATPase